MIHKFDCQMDDQPDIGDTIVDTLGVIKGYFLVTGIEYEGALRQLKN